MLNLGCGISSTRHILALNVPKYFRRLLNEHRKAQMRFGEKGSTKIPCGLAERNKICYGLC